MTADSSSPPNPHEADAVSYETRPTAIPAGALAGQEAVNPSFQPTGPQETRSSVELTPEMIAAVSSASPRTVGKYELVHLLGSGGMGAVYRALDPQIGRQVALKLIRQFETVASSRLRDQFLREARSLARLEAVPGIVTVLDHNFDQTGDEHFFTMRLIEGGTLRRRITQGTPWDALAAVTLVQQLARIIHQAHTVGVIHRDLKPENILIDAEAQPWITDFGIAWSTDPQQRTRTAEADAAAGTLNYMAPEQVQGLAAAMSARTDVYALGVILYELLTGRLPFVPPANHPDPVAYLETCILQQTPFPPRAYVSGLPAALDAIVLKCLAKEPWERYATADELANDLERLLDNQPVAAESLTPLATIWQQCRRRYSAATSCALGCVTQVIVGATVAMVLWAMALLILTPRRTLPARSTLVRCSPVASLLIGVAVSALVLALSFLPAMQDWERRMQDAQFWYRGPRTSSAPVMIVGIDAASLDELTESLVSLSPKLATVVQYLSDHGAAAIGVDFIIPSADATLPEIQPGAVGDAEIFGQAIGQSGRVILPVKYESTANDGDAVRMEPVPQWLAKHALLPEWNDLGAVNLTADRDQILRQQVLMTADGAEAVPHFALAIYGRQQAWADPWEPESPQAFETLKLPTRMVVNYLGPAGTVPAVSLKDVLHAANDATANPEFAAQWAGKMVLIGTTDLSLGDRHLTPYSRRPPFPWLTSYSGGSEAWRLEDQWMAGVEVQANIVASLSDRAWIRRVDLWGWMCLPMLLISVGLSYAAGLLRTTQVLGLLFIAQASWWVGTSLLFIGAAISVPVVPVWLVCWLSPVAVLVWRANLRPVRGLSSEITGRWSRLSASPSVTSPVSRG